MVDLDIMREMWDLHGLLSHSVSAIYSSHTLEHAPPVFLDSTRNGSELIDKVKATLIEWHRVLRVGGILLLSVPDIDTLARLYTNESMNVAQVWHITKMIYGSQFDEGDYHRVGFSYELLSSYLRDAGFCNITRVRSFNMNFRHPSTNIVITDSSDIVFEGQFISLNVVAKVCVGSKGKEGIVFDGFEINHAATPWD